MKVLSLLLLSILTAGSLHAQFVYTINADSVKITNHCDTAELIIENHTQNVPGYLFNKGRGRTEFRRILTKLNDSAYLVGIDTLMIPSQAAWLTNGNAGTIDGVNFLGTTDDIPLTFRVNNQLAGKIDDTYDNAFFGYMAGLNNAGGGNSFFGSQAAYNNTTGFENTILGIQAFFQNTTGYDNVAIGAYSLQGNTTGQYNVAVGEAALGGTSDGSFNVAVGRGALANDASGNNNIGIGHLAMGQLVTGSNNIVIGGNNTNTGAIWLNGSNNTLIGSNLVALPATLSNNIILADGEGNRRINVNAIGNVGIGQTVPTAVLHLKAGTAGVNTAPLKFTTGTLLTATEDGAIEYDGIDLYLTQSATRYKLSKTLTGQLTTSFGAPSLTAFNSITASLTVAGAQPGDVVSVSANTGVVNPPTIIITAYITSANTVTLQAYNASNSAVTLASDTYKVRIIR